MHKEIAALGALSFLYTCIKIFEIEINKCENEK
jgi:hypothetical protein